jgi:hypothetical protein
MGDPPNIVCGNSEYVFRFEFELQKLAGGYSGMQVFYRKEEAASDSSCRNQVYEALRCDFLHKPFISIKIKK